MYVVNLLLGEYKKGKYHRFTKNRSRMSLTVWRLFRSAINSFLSRISSFLHVLTNFIATCWSSIHQSKYILLCFWYSWVSVDEIFIEKMVLGFGRTSKSLMSSSSIYNKLIWNNLRFLQSKEKFRCWDSRWGFPKAIWDEE